MTDLHSRYCALIERQLSTDEAWRLVRNKARADRRRDLYHTDPIWRLTKLKDTRERRLRARRTT